MREDLLCNPPPTFKDFQVWLGLTLNYPFTEPHGFVSSPPPIFKKSSLFFPDSFFSERNFARKFFLNTRDTTSLALCSTKALAAVAPSAVSQRPMPR